MTLLGTLLPLGDPSLAEVRVGSAGPSTGDQRPLTLTYFDRPPYYQNSAGVAEGLLIERARTVSETAGLRVVFREMPAARILFHIERNIDAQCSIGWFPTPERRRYAQFSLPIWQDSAPAILTRPLLADEIARLGRFEAVLGNPILTWAVPAGFSHGDYVDQLRRQRQPTTLELTGNLTAVAHHVHLGRADYAIIAPEEYPALLKAADLTESDLTLVPMQDAPRGTTRHLMCSRQVPGEILARIDEAIRSLWDYGTLTATAPQETDPLSTPP